MRIDEINLIGNFKINGLTGGSSQGIGYSGSSVYWISVTGSGGGSVGPQGNTGPAFVHTSYTDVGRYVAFGDGANGLTFSDSFVYYHTSSTNCQNLIIGPTNSTSRFSTSSVIISSFSASNNSNLNSMIISSSASNICSSNFSFIGSSVNSRICPGSHNSVILASDFARIANNSKNSSSIGGEQSEISNHDSGITLGGRVSRIQSGSFSAILGGDSNCVTGCQSIILGGFQNYAGITNPSVNSVIIGGRNNQFICSTWNSAIIGSKGSALSVSGPSCQSAIIGASGSALFSGDNCIIFEKLHVHNFAKFDQYTNAAPSNGDLWWDQTTGKLMFTTNGNDYCIEC